MNFPDFVFDPNLTGLVTTLFVKKKPSVKNTEGLKLNY